MKCTYRQTALPVATQLGSKGDVRFSVVLSVVFKTPEMHIPPWYRFSWGSTFIVKAHPKEVDGGVKAFVPKAAPFNTAVTLSATPNGTLSSTDVTVAAGQYYSDLVTVDTSGRPVTVSVDSVSWTGRVTGWGMMPGNGNPITIRP